MYLIVKLIYFISVPTKLSVSSTYILAVYEPACVGTVDEYVACGISCLYSIMYPPKSASAEIMPGVTSSSLFWSMKSQLFFVMLGSVTQLCVWFLVM